MNNEDYVSKDIAILLKKKGFDEVCSAFYCGMYKNLVFKEQCDCALHNSSDKFSKDDYAAPTLYQIIKWFRINYKIIINADYEFLSKKWFYELTYIDRKPTLEDYSLSIYNSYEEALNAGILKAIELTYGR